MVSHNSYILCTSNDFYILMNLVSQIYNLLIYYSYQLSLLITIPNLLFPIFIFYIIGFFMVFLVIG